MRFEFLSVEFGVLSVEFEFLSMKNGVLIEFSSVEIDALDDGFDAFDVVFLRILFNMVLVGGASLYAPSAREKSLRGRSSLL